jgi:Bacterial toxin 24
MVAGGVGIGAGVAITTGSAVAEIPSVGTSTVGVVGGVVLTTASAGVATDGARRFSEGVRGLVSEARSKTDPDGDPAAQGRPHSVPDGKGGYTTYGPRDPTTGKPESTKQYRPAPGKPHGNIQRPNVKDRPANTRPDGARVPGRPEVRPPKPEEVPK